ncbi:MAG: BamA/TamA family outer membrane protein [Candidatus Euphemobacter frigidus]|nr:BamA/TamA family outer membrane protein [Candidatus Euphemobacter frigidus]MDP8275044.1 BamA/TamA family outer membrane protein [Candidatus Euphemobacter frigidus]
MKVNRIRLTHLRSLRRGRIPLYFLILPIVWLSPVVSASNWPDSYSVVIEGIDDSGLKEQLEDVSDSVALRDRPPPTLDLLKIRAGSDRDRLEKVLRSNGYFTGKVAGEIKEKGRRVTVVFNVTPGEPFLLKTVDIRIGDEKTHPDIQIPQLAALGLKIGRRATFRSIVEGEAKLISSVKNRGFPFAEVSKREVTADFKARSVDLTFIITPGRRKRFGPTVFKGLKDVDLCYLRDLIPWKEGEIFQPARLVSYREELVGTGLFSVVEVSEGDHADKAGRLPVIVTLQEGKKCSVGLGAGYNTDEGVGGRVSWENRNIFGGAERFKIMVKVAQQTYSGTAVFRKPNFFHPRQSLILAGRVGDDHPPAYTSRSFRVALLTERDLNPSITIGGGTVFKQAHEEQLGEEKDFTLLSLPLYFKWEPPRIVGGKLYFSEEPFYILTRQQTFFKGLLIGKYTLEILEFPYLTLSARVTLGNIAGLARDNIPPDERFYAGGSNTVRGYSYQTVGPLVGKDPTGGRSLLAVSGDLCVKIIGPLGAAVFIDGGSAFASPLPKFNDDILWGAGGGLRYFSPIGPIGLDAATALEKRKGIDSDLYIYVSIGENF